MKNYLLFFLMCIFTNLLAQKASFVKLDSKNTQISDTFFCESVVLKFVSTSNPGTNNDLSSFTFKWTVEKPLTSSLKDTVINNSGEARIRFDAPGKHFIKLEMINKDDKENVYTAFDTIVIRPRPNAWFTVADTFKLGDLKYRFLTGKSPDKKIKYVYKWAYHNIKNTSSINLPDTTAFSSTRDLEIITFPAEGKYEMKLTVTDDKNCSDAYSEIFPVRKSESPMTTTTGFTPNGDGKNDFFTIEVNGRDIYNFQVFDSKGVLKYKSESHSIIWDGYDMNGKEAPTGLYYYILESVQAEIPVKEAGYVMLLRQN